MSIDPNQTKMVSSDPNATRMPGGDQTSMAAFGKSVELSCATENAYAFAPQSSRTHVLASVVGMGGVMTARMPLNLCLVLDRSGSMEGAPLEFMKKACAYVVDLLEPNDVLSIVAFEETAQLVMPARKVVNKALVKDHINKLEVGNTTNIYDAIAMGAGQVASVGSKGYVNRVLLLTDGEPTAGTKDFASIVGQIVEQKSRGITFTALGFGSEYNEELLAAIAKRSGGNYYYIARPDLIPEVFRKELQALMTVVARNLRLRVELSKWVQLRQVYGKLPTFAPRSAEVVLSDLERGETQTALIELEMGPRAGGKYRVARLELIYDDTVTGRSETAEADVVLEFTADGAKLASGINPVVRSAIEVQQASRELERTVMGMRTQQVSTVAAIGELEKTRALLVNQGRTLQADEIGSAIADMRSGGAAEKTLMGTILELDSGKSK